MRVGVTFGMLTNKKLKPFELSKFFFCSSCQIKIHSYMIIYENFVFLTLLSSSYHKKPLWKRRYNTEWVRSLLPLHIQDKNKRSPVREQYGYTYQVTAVIITWYFTSIWRLRSETRGYLSKTNSSYMWNKMKSEYLHKNLYIFRNFFNDFFLYLKKTKQYTSSRYIIFWQIEVKCVVCIAKEKSIL